MSCIICFLEDDFQERIRELSHRKSEKFEKTLEDYRDSFLAELSLLEDISECDIHKSLHPYTLKTAQLIQDFIINHPGTEKFINEIVEVYASWIKGPINDSITKMIGFTTKHKLIQPSDNINNTILYRGRHGEGIFEKSDFYHIPYNKRYLISNQRYSLSGQPLLYLGFSIIDVLYELRGTLETLDEYHFVSFLRISEKDLKVFDFTNPFPEFFRSYEIVIRNTTGKPKNSPDNFGGKTKTGWITEFYKFIFSSICSFKRSLVSESNSFCEEYVLPQLLTEALREISYNGIIYSSTQINKKLCHSEEVIHINRYRENLALFTEYSSKFQYDLDLINQFYISKPICLNDKLEITESDLILIRKQLVKLFESNPDIVASSNRNINWLEMSGMGTELNCRKLYITDSCKDTPYFEHDVGKIQLNLVYQIVKELRNTINKLALINRTSYSRNDP